MSDRRRALGRYVAFGIVAGAAILAVVVIRRTVQHPQTDDAVVMPDTIGVVLNYRITVLPWFYVQPDIQGIINPGAAHQFGDALVLGLQFGRPF